MGRADALGYPRTMPVVDVHYHAFPDALAASAVAALAAQGHVVARYDGTISGVLAAMDASGVDVGVVQPVATKPGQVRSINDWVSTVGSSRIVPFGAMHPDFPDPATEIRRMRRELGLRGFKLHPEHQDFEPHEPRMEAIYRAALDEDMIVFFHAGGDLVHDSVRGTPDSFVRVLQAWPGLRCVLAHMGGFNQWHAVTGRLAGRDAWFDTAYTLGYLPDDEFVALAREHGCERVLLGTDGPWSDAAEQIAHLRRLPFTDDELAGILGGNAARLLAL